MPPHPDRPGRTIIRNEAPGDHLAVHRLLEAAFGRPQEADLVDRLRDIDPHISLVAVLDGQVVGHIYFSPVAIESARDAQPPPTGLTLGLGPMAVLPAHQNQGIGSQLVRQGLDVCRQRDVTAVVVVGHPGFYPRFGFVPARALGLECEFPVPDEVWLVLDLLPPGPTGRRTGTVRYRPEFAAAAEGHDDGPPAAGEPS